MPYLIVENAFSPKCPLYGVEFDGKNVHSISYNKCNFRCEYCYFYDYLNTNHYVEYSEKALIAKFYEMIKKGIFFKFTGGEPTLNPNIERDICIVKSLGGKVFLDTNGSNTCIVEKLIDKEMIDLIGISLKGLDKKEALKRSGIKKEELCWDKVFRTIDLVSKSKVNLIITYVCYKDFDYSQLVKFSSLLEGYPGVFLKINNFQQLKKDNRNIQPAEQNRLLEVANRFVDERPEWRGRITLVLGEDAVKDFEKLVIV